MKWNIDNSKCNAPPSFTDAIDAAANQFKDLVCDRITEVCNEQCEYHRRQALAMCPEDTYCIGKDKYKAEVWVKELKHPFDLSPPPQTICFQILLGTSCENPPAAAEARVWEDLQEFEGTIRVYFERFQWLSDHWQVIPKEDGELKEVVWKELQHACGDLDKDDDGAIRHNLVVAVVIALLEQQGRSGKGG